MCSSEQIQILDPDVIGGEHDFDHLLQRTQAAEEKSSSEKEARWYSNFFYK